MATLNDVISCYNELVDEVNGHTASIDKLNARIEDAMASLTASIETLTARLADVPTSTAMASLTAKLSQVEARLDELVQEHDVMMDTISSLLAAPAPTVEEETEGTVELKRVGKRTVEVEEPAPKTVVEESAQTLKRVGKRTVESEAPVVEEQPAPTPASTVEEPAPTEAVAALKRASAPKTVEKKKTTTTEIQKRAFARQYMVEHGAKVEDLRNPERINETIASDEFTAWMNAR